MFDRIIPRYLYIEGLNMVSLSTILTASTVTTTILQYLSGALVCRKIIQQKTTGDSSAFPFICGFLSCSMWLKYGFLANEDAVIIVNTVGSTLFLAYSLVFWKYASNIKMTYQQFFTALMVLCLTFTYTEWYEVNRAEAIKVVGYLCCTVTVLFFAAPCCMLVDVFQKKSTEMLPMPLILMSFLVSVQWFALGLLAKDLFLQVPNLMGALLSGTQLMLFCIYPSKSRETVQVGRNEVPYAIF